MKEININGFREPLWPALSTRALQGYPRRNNGHSGLWPTGSRAGFEHARSGLNVVLGVRPGRSWDKALADGWVAGENLFEMEEALEEPLFSIWFPMPLGDRSVANG